MKKCAVIIPYYGKWPRFMDLYLNSCVHNQWFDIIFITDLDLPQAAGSNVKKVHIPWNQLQQYVSGKLNAEVTLHSYYKLCDLKPMYGLIFQEYIKNYEFWAFGDIDLIYGNTGRFLTSDLLNGYDIVTFRTEWLSGALTLFRNTDMINNLFRESPDWQKVVSSTKHYSFTEVARKYKEIVNGTSVFNVDADIISMTAVCKKAAVENRVRYYEKKIIKESIVPGDYLVVDHGVIKDSKGNEYLHYHYITEKSSRYFSFPKWQKIPEQFYITPTGFYTVEKFKWEPVIKWWRMMSALRKTAGKKLTGKSKAVKK